jgi:hypothetical protein
MEENGQQDPLSGQSIRGLTQSFRDLAPSPLSTHTTMRRIARTDNTPDRAISPLEYGNPDLRTGSVSFRQDVSSQSVRGKGTSVTENNFRSSPHQSFGQGNTLSDEGSKSGYSNDRLFRRLDTVERLVDSQNHLEHLGTQTEVGVSPGDFRYFSSTATQAPTGGLPARFVHGRESVSVLNNVTVR